MSPLDKPLAWLAGEVKTPPFSPAARLEAGILLRRLQRGEMLTLPHSRPMPSIAPRCHELRITDRTAEWRIVYRLDADAVLVADVFAKKTEATPLHVIVRCRARLREFDRISRETNRHGPAQA
ncbi:MAG TPA: type II toxin-antitoxin system RelE/ParE family toxin [Longimicrobium sp.]|nr:type II toxin-antitoxin system RelE/ParE family toxin [Longimicrobium sp.]